MTTIPPTKEKPIKESELSDNAYYDMYDKVLAEPYQILHINNCVCSICNELNTYLHK
jgi:hypothetical protein